MTRWRDGDRVPREITTVRILMLEEATWKRDATRYYYTALALLAWFQHTYPRVYVRPSHAYQIALDIVGKL